MDIKSKLLNPKFQQSALEVVFPLAGYYFWKCSLIIIIVFYLCDFLSSQIMYTRRLSKIVSYNNYEHKSTVTTSVIVFIILFTSIILFLTEVFSLTAPNSRNLEQLIFFTKDELWYLLPIIILMYHMMDKMFFYTPRRFTNHKPKPYFSKNLYANLIACPLIILSSIAYYFYKPSDIVTIIMLVLSKLFYDYIIKKQLLSIEH